MRTGVDTPIDQGVNIFVFSSYIGNRVTSKIITEDYNSAEDNNPESRPSPQSTI